MREVLQDQVRKSVSKGYVRYVSCTLDLRRLCRGERQQPEIGLSPLPDGLRSRLSLTFARPPSGSPILFQRQLVS